MPELTLNGRTCSFESGQNILQVALDNGIEVPHYCWHPSLSVVANCRICLAEVWAPNPRNGGKLEPMPKLVPTCQTMASEGQVVYTDSPKAIGNQKAVMEYLLINHPVDCPVCDQAGECHLQDYSYQYGRSQARFQEQKIKQPKKDIGPHVMLYSDRCIMCTRCVRFTREITETGELMVDGRGAYEQIDIFPGKPLDNPLSGNVIDLCPVGALLDKDFLFQQRVWLLKKTPSIDGLTSSGDNISVHHNDGTVYRIKPRHNEDVNGHWITDEVRYGWKHVHSNDRFVMPLVRGAEPFGMDHAREAWDAAYAATNARLAGTTDAAAKRVMVMVSPMLSCEDAYWLATWARSLPGDVTFAVGPVPTMGEDQVFADGFTLRAEKAPNARGVRRVLKAMGGSIEYDAAVRDMASGGYDAVVLSGNYPSDWATEPLTNAIPDDAFVVLIDTLTGPLLERADVVLPSATWMEKSGTFENADGIIQAFDRAIDPIDYCKGEAQLAIDLMAARLGEAPAAYNPANTRQQMVGELGLSEFASITTRREDEAVVLSDMELVEL
ncbi:MAG: molybdopterin-dependent oxidoreductase [Phycisphaerales bacterium]